MEITNRKEEFLKTHISRKELVAKMEVSDGAVSRWIKLGKLTPIAFPGINGSYFSHTEVEKLFPSN